MSLTLEVALALAEDAATLAALHERELTPPVLRELAAIGFPDNLALLPRNAAQAEAFTLMRTAVLACVDPAIPIDDLAAEFAAIYLTGAYGASPCESVWLSDEHLICQEAMFELRDLYTACGFAVPDWRKRPDDHLVFQLQFLARRLAVLRDDAGLRALAAFLDEHLLRWLPDFATRLAARCEQQFYAALAILTNSWCQQLRDHLAEQLHEPRPTPEEIVERLQPRSQRHPFVAPVRFVPGGAAPSW
ncbi:MAG TPA: molecular chaperone TorD family protein [Accumulibacter sp.]|uniref:TorD/DmsD family molecular chaperone n=1 Tax=Accumulibacter sp. TaxID=2053492 RepID=UPI0026366A48|nr:molecular chaperone TorD family protein [Accumulibacter sp.]MDS4056227.1 molecular chaperone TorD family protein [Accumulibacter sp.]HMV05739.1 molecular chaperone TorD family protein [Accumulibacter sp.]HNC28274.1 molecular chaperone TorD family protein [Accumulibacter sp.]HND40414.1 molecular chaperone TorD family protein [Accumulibacter sp.]HNE40782.1 molecular chaperone TorD family protein [Accumulibacter sp.]